jgi:phenylalanyl-tRNA synthetase beta chain
MFELELDAVLQRDVPAFQEVLKHQPVERDLAIVVAESVTHDAVMQAVWAAPTEGLLRDALLFDVYRPKTQAQSAGDATPASGEKSLALRLTINGAKDSLTEAQIEAAVKSVLERLATGVKARLRA